MLHDLLKLSIGFTLNYYIKGLIVLIVFLVSIQ